MPICLPATELYYNNVVNYTAMVSGRSTMCSLQQCRMEDHNKPNVLDEFVGINTEEEKFQSLFPEMEDEKKSYLDMANRVHAAVIPGPGHGPARAQQEDLEKKIPLVTRRSSLESSVIGLEVGQVDQGKRVLVQYIYYNLIISVFNN